MENKILIKENTELCKSITQDLHQFMPVLNELKASYEALEIGAFTNDTFKKIVLLGSQKTVEDYVKSLNDQLDKFGVTNSIMRKNAIKDHEIVINRFQNSVSKAKSFIPETYSTTRPKLTLKQISYENKFCINKEDIESILETYCRVYLDNEEEKQFFETTEQLVNSYNDFMEMYNKAMLQNANPFKAITDVLKVVDNKMAIDPAAFKQICTYKSRKESYDNLKTKGLK